MKLNGYIYTPSCSVVFSTSEKGVLIASARDAMGIEAYMTSQPFGLVSKIISKREGQPFELTMADLKLLAQVLVDPPPRIRAEAHELRVQILAQLVILHGDFNAMNPTPLKG